MSQIVSGVALFLAIFWSLFLFWRACHHELIESEQAFDVTIIATIGAIIGARVFDFLENIDTIGLSISRFIFFNAYGGFDFRGAALGAGLAVFLFLRRKKVRTLQVFDLAAAPIVFGQLIFNFVKFLGEGFEKGKMFAYYSIGYLLIFLVLKRLATRKRHFGFFICFWLVAISFLDILIISLFGENRYSVLLGYKVPFNTAVAASYLVIGVMFWYLFSKRSFIRDLRSMFASLLLSVFRFRRMTSSVDESGRFSKSIVLFPLFVSKFVVGVIKLVVREIKMGFLDFLYVLGLRHDRY